MRAEDKIYLDEHAKRVDDRHERLLTYLSVEFERTNKHLSNLNGKVSEHERDISRAKGALYVISGVLGVIITTVIFNWDNIF